ncbi:uncharacterized protein METZ01_LOCUS215157, partial [marine metagenome]
VLADQSEDSFLSWFRRKMHDLTLYSEILLDNTVFVYYNQIHNASAQNGGARVEKNRNWTSPIQVAGHRRSVVIASFTASHWPIALQWIVWADPVNYL